MSSLNNDKTSKGKAKTKSSTTKKKKTKTSLLTKEIIGILVIALAVFLFVVTTQTEQIGLIGTTAKYILVALVGKGFYVFPYVVLIIGVLELLNIIITSDERQIIAPLGLFVSLLIYMTLNDVKRFNIFTLDSSILNIIKYSFQNGQVVRGGGLIGNVLTYILIKLVGLNGIYIVLTALVIVFIILFTNQSLIGFFKSIFRFIKSVFKAIGNFIFVEENEDSSKPKKKTHKPQKDSSSSENENIKIFDYTGEQLQNKSGQNKNITQLKIEDIKPSVPKEKVSVEKKNPEIPKKTVNEVDDNVVIPKPEENKPVDNKIDDDIIINSEDTPKTDIEYKLPPIDLLNTPKNNNTGLKDDIRRDADKLIETLNNFNIQCKIVQINKGPTITRYELQPAPGIKVSKITSLANDLALSLATSEIRIEAPIPGKSAVGIEVPNKTKSDVLLKSLIESNEYKEMNTNIPFALGKDIAGKNIVGSIEKMPHLLVAGATGSGKSVCINTLIMSILYRAKPEDVKLILIDPKVVELNVYNGIPHLLIPVVTDPRKASNALNWAVNEMTNRYKIFAQNGVRDIFTYNSKISKEKKDEKLPQIVIIIDELADLMQVAPGEVEECITRLAQLARACGIHLVIATQRPSVDVITGTIKANIPSRIAFAVSSYIDSRTILDCSGAEKLLGKGDMLYHPMGMSKPIRVQGTFISDDEIKRVVDYITQQKIELKSHSLNEELDKAPSKESDCDELLEQIIDLVVEEGQASASYLQRKFKIGYSRAARIIDQLEERGIVGGYEGSKPRKVLITKEELEELKQTSETIETKEYI